MDDTHRELLQQAIAGDHAALMDLLEQCAPAIRRRLAGRIPLRLRALLSEDDVLQQTYTDAFLGISSFVKQDGYGFVAWLNTLATRNLIDAIRMLEADKRGGGRKRVEPRCEDDSCQALFELLAATSTTPSRQIAKAEAVGIIRQAIQKLPEIHRQVVVQCDLEGQALRDVAACLGRSPGAISMLRIRAHARLAEIMGAASKYLSTSA